MSALHADRALVLVEASDVHAEGETHLPQDVLDLLERLAPEIAVLEHLGLALLDQVADALDLGRAQAVARPHRKLELHDALVEHLPHPHDVLVDSLLDLSADRLLDSDLNP